MNRPDLTPPQPPVTELAGDALNHAASQDGEEVRQLVAGAGDLTQRRVEQWRGRAEAWRDGTSEHIRAHPLRAVLIATGTGMVLALLARALSR